MATPIPSDSQAMIRDLAQKVARLGNHKHPGTVVVTEPEEITGDRSSDTVDILRQVLAALDAAGIIVDNTTG